MRFRSTSSSQLLVALALALLVLFLFLSQRRLGLHQGAQRQTKTHVLILSSWRSGSTFAGQLFSQNPEVFYMMEPAKHVWKRMPWGNPELLHGSLRDLLRSIFLCDMAALCAYIESPSKVKQLFMWPMSRALCSPPACEAFSRSDIVDFKECYAQCGHTPFQKISEACATYSHIVVKTVRFLQLKALFPLLTDPSLHLHVIHLVRDPRAVYASRKVISLLPDDLLLANAVNATSGIQGVMHQICHSQTEMYLTALHHMPPAWRGRYLLTRYEDLVRDPLGHLAKWYHFTGLSSSPRLEAWVYNITHWSTSSGNMDPLAIQKNANVVSQAWRKRLSFQEVQEVQANCRQAMEVFGYRPVGSEEEQGDLRLDLVLPQRKMNAHAKGP